MRLLNLTNVYSVSPLPAAPQNPPLASLLPVISTWVCTICGPNPPPPCDLLHSGKEMEVIHSGNCDCPFPGRGCSWETPEVFSQGPRPPPHAFHCGLDRIGQRKRQVRRPPARQGQPSTCRHCRAPESAAAPRPLLFVTARLPVCGRRPRLTSRTGKPLKATSFSGTLPLGPAACLLRVPPLAREPAPGRSRGKQEPRRVSRRDGRVVARH